MAENEKNLREWSEKLEAGQRDDELLALAARLERAGQDEQAAPTVEFRRQLRRELLNSHAPAGDGPARRVWRWAGSLAALALLGVIVVTTWLSMSSAGRVTPGGGPADSPAGAEAVSTNVPGYQFLGYTTNGGVVIEQVAEQSETGETINQMEQHLLIPGLTMTVTLRWSMSPEAAGVSAFVQLLDDDGRIVVQADGPVLAATEPIDQPFVSTLALNLPADLPTGQYDLVAGLNDPATGARLPFNTEQEQDQSLRVLLRGDYEVSGSAPLGLGPEFDIRQAHHNMLHSQVYSAEADALAVHEVSPPAGAEVAGNAPTEFVITVDYALKSLPQAVLEVRVVEDLGNESGRGVGLGTVDLTEGVGTITVTVEVDPATEMAGPADLDLLLHLKPDAASAPIVTIMPDNVGWPYRP
jgi:hypothetical protein